MKTRNWIKRIGICFWVCFLLILPMETFAKEASVTFGSESYAQEQGKEFHVGVYFKTDIPHFTYEGSLQYDTTMLQYMWGADREEDGVLYFSGSEEGLEKKYMLNFLALQEGNTTITVSGSKIVAAEEELPITMIGQAPITLTEASAVEENTIIEETENIETETIETMDLIEESATADEGEETTFVDEAEANTVADESGEIEATAVDEIQDTEEGSNAIEESLIDGETGENNTEDNETLNIEETDTSISNDGVEETTAETESDLEEEGIPEVIPNEIEVLIALLVVVMVIVIGIWIRKKYGEEKELEPEIQEDDSLQWLSIEELEDIDGISAAYEKNQDSLPVVIAIKDVSMCFRINESNVSSLKEYMIKTVKKEHSYRNLKALNHIALDIKKGEIVGVIGTNGSGKSTL